LRYLKRRFPQSRWQKDAGALEIEVKQTTGQSVKPADQSDEELKMLAIQGLMNSDSERAMPLLEKVLNGSAAPKENRRRCSCWHKVGRHKHARFWENRARTEPIRSCSGRRLNIWDSSGRC